MQWGQPAALALTVASAAILPTAPAPPWAIGTMATLILSLTPIGTRTFARICKGVTSAGLVAAALLHGLTRLNPAPDGIAILIDLALGLGGLLLTRQMAASTQMSPTGETGT